MGEAGACCIGPESKARTLDCILQVGENFKIGAYLSLAYSRGSPAEVGPQAV